MKEPEILARIAKLRPSRRMIMTEYFKIRNDGGRSITRTISTNLNYKITNGRNKFVERVIRDFLKEIL